MFLGEFLDLTLKPLWWGRGRSFNFLWGFFFLNTGQEAFLLVPEPFNPKGQHRGSFRLKCTLVLLNNKEPPGLSVPYPASPVSICGWGLLGKGKMPAFTSSKRTLSSSPRTPTELLAQGERRVLYPDWRAGRTKKPQQCLLNFLDFSLPKSL